MFDEKNDKRKYALAVKLRINDDHMSCLHNHIWLRVKETEIYGRVVLIV